MDFEKLEQICAERGFSIAYLERATNLGNGTIRNWKNGKAGFANVAKVAEFLGIPMESLLKDDEHD